MALVSAKDGKRYDIPHEPGQWMRIRPLKASDESLRQKDFATNVDRELAILEAIIIEWSYEPAPSAETIADLDRPTLYWLDQVVLPELNDPRSDSEKKASEGGLSRRPRAAAPSPQSSDT